MSHTERLVIHDQSNAIASLTVGNFAGRGDVSGWIFESVAHQINEKENATRLCDCWNACINIPDPAAAISAAREAMKYSLANICGLQEAEIFTKLAAALKLIGGGE